VAESLVEGRNFVWHLSVKTLKKLVKHVGFYQSCIFNSRTFDLRGLSVGSLDCTLLVVVHSPFHW